MNESGQEILDEEVSSKLDLICMLQVPAGGWQCHMYASTKRHEMDTYEYASSDENITYVEKLYCTG